MRRPLAAVTVAIALATVAACGDDAPDAAAPTTAAPTIDVPTTAPTSQPPTTTAAATTTVVPSTTLAASSTVATTVAEPVLDAEALTAMAEADAARLPTSPGQVITVRSPSRGIDLTVAVGSSSFGGPPLEPDASFRLASVTKTFTAAAVLRLVERGDLSLDDDLAAAGVPPELIEVLRADGYDVGAMTVGHLLGHSSGAFDYAFGDEVAYLNAVLADPFHRWTRAEQVRFAAEHGDPLGAPGEVTGYSDTGYVLLGAILEARTGRSYGDAMAELLDYEGLGLEHTVWEAPGAMPVTERAHQYYGETDTTTWDPSIDLYGGGGLVSTSADVATFFAALADGGVFDDPATFETMATPTGPEPTLAKGLFLAVVDGGRCVLHEGFWGVVGLTCPELDLTISRSWLQAVPAEGWSPNDLLRQIVELLA